MTEYQKGQRVKVELEGTIQSLDEAGMYVAADEDKTYAHFVWVDHATIIPLDPPDWPPQPGDIWEADGEEWFARQNINTAVMAPAAGQARPLDWFKDRNPVLVRRREK
jgi:hypothetical protein